MSKTRLITGGNGRYAATLQPDRSGCSTCIAKSTRHIPCDSTTYDIAFQEAYPFFLQCSPAVLRDAASRFSSSRTGSDKPGQAGSAAIYARTDCAAPSRSPDKQGMSHALALQSSPCPSCVSSPADQASSSRQHGCSCGLWRLAAPCVA